MLQDMIVIVLRYSLLVLLYLFIWRLFVHMLTELRGMGEDELRNTPRSPTVEEQVTTWASGSGMLKVLEGPAGFSSPGYGYVIDNVLSIGRSSDNQVVINSPFVSGQHARIVLQGGEYILADLGSRNGTLVNGVKVKKPVPLAEGDKLQIGEAVFDFVRWANEVESAD